jgi:hypothetical protein
MIPHILLAWSNIFSDKEFLVSKYLFNYSEIQHFPYGFTRRRSAHLYWKIWKTFTLGLEKSIFFVQGKEKMMIKKKGPFKGYIFLFLMATNLGCLGSISLHKAVMSYDETISRLESEMLLLNIARTYANFPHHFTLTSNVAATFDYQATGGFAGTFYQGAPGLNTYGLSLGATVAENPTFNIVPMGGEEFTTRILTPMDEDKFLFLVLQGAPLGMVLRLMVQGIELQNPDGSFKQYILNWQGQQGYAQFRQIVLRLAELNQRQKLFIVRLVFDESLRAKLSSPPSASDLASALEKGYRWTASTKDDTYILTKPTIGRVVITNFDVRDLSNAEREALNTQAAANPNNYVLLDIRPGPGVEERLCGEIKLRSLNVMLDFLTASIDDHPEDDPAPSTGSGEMVFNPRRVLTILLDKPSPPGAIQVTYRGHVYAVRDTPWDGLAFQLLYQLYQITVQKITGVGAPLITISK